MFNSWWVLKQQGNSQRTVREKEEQEVVNEPHADISPERNGRMAGKRLS